MDSKNDEEEIMTKKELARVLRQIDGHILKAHINLGEIASKHPKLTGRTRLVKRTRIELSGIFRMLVRIATGHNISLKEWKEAGR